MKMLRSVSMVSKITISIENSILVNN